MVPSRLVSSLLCCLMFRPPAASPAVSPSFEPPKRPPISSLSHVCAFPSTPLYSNLHLKCPSFPSFLNQLQASNSKSKILNLTHELLILFRRKWKRCQRASLLPASITISPSLAIGSWPEQQPSAGRRCFPPIKCTCNVQVSVLVLQDCVRFCEAVQCSVTRDSRCRS